MARAQHTVKDLAALASVGVWKSDTRIFDPSEPFSLEDITWLLTDLFYGLEAAQP